MNDTKKSKLVRYGGEGCIFIPELPCDYNTKRGKMKKTKRKRKTKLLFNNVQSHEDRIATMIVKKSKNYSDWCLLWDRKCISKDYKILKQVSEVEQCFIKKHKQIPSEKDKFRLLHGDYIGITSSNYYVNIFNQSVISDLKVFKMELNRMFLSMRSLFIGLVELQRIGICHNDIKIENVIYNDGSLYYIDFGLSFTFRNCRSVIPRMTNEYKSGRIYESYPFEYIYYPKLTKTEIRKEQVDISYQEKRINYAFCEYIHERLFGRNVDLTRSKMLEDKLNRKNIPNLELLTKKLDVYSLGTLPLMLLIEACNVNDIDIDVVFNILKSEEYMPMMKLLYDMTEQDYRNRITANEAYNRYLNLIKEMT